MVSLPLPLPIEPLAKVRERLSQVVAVFRRDGSSAAPIIFGTHRKPEAVLLSYEAYRRLVDRVESTQAMAAAFASVRAEGLEPTAGAIARSERVLRGDISEDEAYEETVRQYRRP